jgi:hypothetical protein
MAANFETTTPKKLLVTFKKAIDDGHIVTWEYDKTSGDFTHTPPQWKNKAWLRPTVYEGQRLVFNIIGRNDEKLLKATYGLYHGRFIESMLTHCDGLFTVATATAAATNRDMLAA